jgi:scyllo-inositol 2-dehydrogenase (NADP+)
MIKFATIGTNWITEEFIKAAKEVPSFALTAVYSRTEEKAKEFAAKVGVERTFTSLEEMAKSDENNAAPKFPSNSQTYT